MAQSLYRKFLSHRAGSIAILAGLLMPVIVGGLGLGAEVGYWYFNQRKLQNAADVAAYASGAQLRAEKDQATLEAAAMAAAVKTGYTASIGSVTTTTPPSTGAFAGDANAVEVVVQENVPRMFSALFQDGDVPMSGRAVARLEVGNAACIIALDPNKSGAVTFTGSSDVVLDGCNVHANSLATDAVAVIGTGRVETPCASTMGNVLASNGLVMGECNHPIENASKIEDPYEDVPEPSLSDPCEPVTVFDGPPSATYTISPGKYCGGLTIKRTVTMNSGVYVVSGGDMVIESTAVVRGTGVTIFLTDGARLRIAGTASVRLRAPTSGTYAGILIFVDRDEPYATHIINGDSTSYFDGAVYAPSGHVEVAGSGTVGGGCTQIVASTIEFTGDAGIGADCTGLGITQVFTKQLVKLVE